MDLCFFGVELWASDFSGWSHGTKSLFWLKRQTVSWESTAVLRISREQPGNPITNRAEWDFQLSFISF